MRITRAVVVLGVLWAAGASGECLPAGRTTFAAGLDALSRGDLEEAHARFAELVKAQPKCTEARNNLAVVLFEMGRTEEADTQLRQAVEEDPDYQRARFNLRRVESSFRGEAAKPEVETALAGDPTAVPPTAAATLAPAATAAPVATARPSAPPAAVSDPAAPGYPAQLAALEPVGATACVIDVTQKQLCAYRRAGAGIVREACFPFVATDVSTWPQWVTASDLTVKRIRLVDHALQRRLRIIPEGVQMDYSVRLGQRDFTTLSGTVVPWRSGWVIVEPGAPALSGALASQAQQEVREALDGWRRAWEGKQFDSYNSFYAAAFVPQAEGDPARWRTRKRALFEQSGTITVRVAAPSIFVVGDGSTVLTTFEQTYSAGSSEVRDFKLLRWQRSASRWQITAETVLADRSPARPVRRRGG